MILLEAEDLAKTYFLGGAEIRALQGVSLSVQAGEFLAIMGPSGSGKSTLMHLLGFLDLPDRGLIRWMGADQTHLTDEEAAFLRNRVIGFVFQQFNLMPRSNALENVMLPLLYSDAPERKTSRPAEALRAVGLGERMRHRPSQLSGGQQQRVAIARALINQPRVILADEPTGNLDSQSGSEIMKILKGLHGRGMTVILVTHDEQVAKFADRIVKMADGKIISDERKAASTPVSVWADSGIPQIRKKTYDWSELREHFIQAFRMIISNKLRSILSMLGVLIGVACVITMLALGKGARETITEQLSKMGSNLLGIRGGSSKVHGIAQEAGAVTRFTAEDIQAILDSKLGVVRVAPQVRGSVRAVYGNNNWATALVGTTPEYAVMKNQVPVMGRFFSAEEVRARRRVALLGQTVIQELFGSENPIGKTIKINRIYFQIIGILPSLGFGGPRDQDDIILTPLSTAMYRVLGRDYIEQIDVEIASLEQMPAAEEGIRRLIIRRHRLTPERYDTFSIRNYNDIQEALTTTTRTFSVLLGSVAAISLLVGGIGIMNIMLVSVKERTREIGLRKAVGATQSDILKQFLVEAIVITFLGGAAGVLLAIFLSWGIAAIFNWKMVVSLGSLLLAFVFSAMVGIIFGLWPARQAARLDPIQALRYE